MSRTIVVSGAASAICAATAARLTATQTAIPPTGGHAVPRVTGVKIARLAAQPCRGLSDTRYSAAASVLLPTISIQVDG